MALGPQFYLETDGQGLWFDATGGDTADIVIVAGFETGVPHWSDIYFDLTGPDRGRTVNLSASEGVGNDIEVCYPRRGDYRGSAVHRGGCSKTT